jgi:cytochrome c biogenesis protein ResB
MSGDRSSVLRRLYRFWARLDVAATLLFILLLLAALGSCLPQISPSAAADADRLAEWEVATRAKYGALAGLLTTGRASYFRSSVFVLPILLLAVATLVCTLDRWRRVWRRAFHTPVRCPDSVFETASHAVELTVDSTVDASHLLGEALEQRGFRVRFESMETALHLRGDRNRLAPLATLVTHLAVLLVLLGAALTSGGGWRKEITVGPGQSAGIGRGSGLALRNEGFTVTRYADGSASGYEARVVVAEGDQDVKRGHVRLNEPLVYNGIRFTLQGYQATGDEYTVTLLAVRDPGLGLVVGAGFLLLLGLTVSFNFPHCRVYARAEPEGRLRVIGRAGRQAPHFGREFAALAAELEQVIGR